MSDTVKMVFCVRRRPDVPVQEFHRYWLEDHARLVTSVSENLGMRRYVQSHVVRGEATDVLTASRDLAEPFDGIAEVWFDADAFDGDMTEEQIRANLELIEDERKFIDLERSVAFFSTEFEIF